MQSCYLDSLASVPGGLGVAPLSTLSLVAHCKSACTCPAHRHIGQAAVQVTPAASALVFRVLQTLLNTCQRPVRITVIFRGVQSVLAETHTVFDGYLT